MREKLAIIDGIRARFTATFIRFGSKKAFKGPPIKTLLFHDVKDSKGKIVTGHLWFTTNQQFERLNLSEGKNIIVSFEARVTPYIKGYRGTKYDDWKTPSKDYKLSHPSKVAKFDPGTQNLLF